VQILGSAFADGFSVAVAFQLFYRIRLVKRKNLTFSKKYVIIYIENEK